MINFSSLSRHVGGITDRFNFGTFLDKISPPKTTPPVARGDAPPSPALHSQQRNRSPSILTDRVDTPHAVPVANEKSILSKFRSAFISDTSMVKMLRLALADARLEEGGYDSTRVRDVLSTLDEKELRTLTTEINKGFFATHKKSIIFSVVSTGILLGALLPPLLESQDFTERLAKINDDLKGQRNSESARADNSENKNKELEEDKAASDKTKQALLREKTELEQKIAALEQRIEEIFSNAPTGSVSAPDKATSNPSSTQKLQIVLDDLGFGQPQSSIWD